MVWGYCFHRVVQRTKQRGMKTREKAIKWWRAMSFEDKYFKIVKNSEVVFGYPDRDPNTLTGREVEIIYNKERL